MRILFYGPNCGSGIEQIGFVYLLLLKSLGHEIDYINTQDNSYQCNELSKLIHSDRYDKVILNEPYGPFWNKIKIHDIAFGKIYAICHSSSQVPHNVIALSLNYNYHMRVDKTYSVIYPLIYPFSYKPLKIKPISERKYNLAYIGRWNSAKFHPKVRDYFNSTDSTIDYACISSIEKDYNTCPIKEQYTNLPIDKVYDLLLETRYLLLPSTTECLSLVVGEAQACGCTSIVLETEDKEHDQFSLVNMNYTIAEFISQINSILEYPDIQVKVNNIKSYKELESIWHIARVKQYLIHLFGRSTGSIGVINLLTPNESMDQLALNNAQIITSSILSNEK